MIDSEKEIYICELCGKETGNSIRIHGESEYHSICSQCAAMSQEQIVELPKPLQVYVARPFAVDEFFTRLSIDHV